MSNTIIHKGIIAQDQIFLSDKKSSKHVGIKTGDCIFKYKTKEISIEFEFLQFI